MTPSSTMDDDLRRSLPQELVCQIFACLDGDVQSLKSCSLVSKHWRASCGHHLFRSLTLDSHNVADFLAFSGTQSNSSFSTFLSGVKHLRVSEYWLFHYSAWVVGSQAEIHRLSSVTSLCLHGILWNDSASLVDFVRAFQHLRELEMHENTFDSIGIVLEAIDGLPSLDRLFFRKIEFKRQVHTISDYQLSYQGTSNFRELQFSEGSLDVFCKWLDLLSHASLANITSLCVLDMKESHVESFGNVIRNLGSSLEHLEIGLYMRGTYAIKEASFSRHVDLSKNHNLRNLQVNVTRFYPQRSFYLDPDTHFAIHGIIPTIFSQIHLIAPLEYLAFGIRAIGPKNDSIWLEFGNLLERVVLLGLKTVLFDLYPAPIGDRDVEEWEKYIRRFLPDCSARGILRFTTGKKSRRVYDGLSAKRFK